MSLPDFHTGPPRYQPVSTRTAQGFTFHGPIGYEERDGAMTPEAKLTAAVVRYLNRLKAVGQPIWWTKLAGSPMQRRGLPDLLIVYRGWPVFVELKASGRKPTPLQAEVMRKINRAGATAVACWSVEEVKALLEW